MAPVTDEPALTIKEMLLSVYKDMQFVRPAVQTLVEARLPDRMTAVETSDRERTAKTSGIFATLGVGKSVILLGFAAMGAAVSAFDLIARLARP